MIVKNQEAIHRMITRLDTILETDDTVSNLDRKWIHQAQIALRRINGTSKVSTEEHLRVLGYPSE